MKLKCIIIVAPFLKCWIFQSQQPFMSEREPFYGFKLDEVVVVMVFFVVAASFSNPRCNIEPVIHSE